MLPCFVNEGIHKLKQLSGLAWHSVLQVVPQYFQKELVLTADTIRQGLNLVPKKGLGPLGKFLRWKRPMSNNLKSSSKSLQGYWCNSSFQSKNNPCQATAPGKQHPPFVELITKNPTLINNHNRWLYMTVCVCACVVPCWTRTWQWERGRRHKFSWLKAASWSECASPCRSSPPCGLGIWPPWTHPVAKLKRPKLDSSTKQRAEKTAH